MRRCRRGSDIGETVMGTDPQAALALLHTLGALSAALVLYGTYLLAVRRRDP